MMSLLSRLFKSSRSLPAVSQPYPLSPSVNPVNSPTVIRRELLRVVLRDTLGKHGIPANWIGCEVLVSSANSREPGVHLRLVLRHWDARLMLCAPALQKSLQLRLEQFDPLAMHWFRGMSWQFDLPDASICPPLPSDTVWTHAPGALGATTATTMDALLATSMAPALTASTPPIADKLADLNKLFEEGDKPRKRYGDGPDGAAPINFEATQPLFAATEPARL